MQDTHAVHLSAVALSMVLGRCFLVVLSAALALLVYIPTVLWHKIGICIAGHRLNRRLAGTGLRIPARRLLCHDWPKFLPAELLPYARHHFKSNLGAHAVGRFVAWTGLPKFVPVWTESTPSAFERAVSHHVHLQDHHLQFWEQDGVGPMTDVAVVEMVADHFAANWGYAGKWPRPGDWPYLTAQRFDSMKFPTQRSRALYFAILGSFVQ